MFTSFTVIIIDIGLGDSKLERLINISIQRKCNKNDSEIAKSPLTTSIIGVCKVIFPDGAVKSLKLDERLKHDGGEVECHLPGQTLIIPLPPSRNLAQSGESVKNLTVIT